jgi:enoyl-CoA hydratase/carnithine racemase
MEIDANVTDDAGSFTQLRLDGVGPVRWLRLDRPERHNAQTECMWSELARAGRLLSADPEVRCVVVAGAGRSFSSGIDLDEMRRSDGFIRRLAARPPGTPDPMLADLEVVQDAIRWIPAAPFLVVAAVRGIALGAGCQLALACDIRIVADDAVLALKEIDYGLLPDLGATAWLPRLVGTQLALDLILTGRELSGAQFHAAGLAFSVHPADEVESAAAAYAERLAAVPRPALSYVKAAVYEPDPGRSLRLAAEGQAACIRQARLPAAAGPVRPRPRTLPA